MPRSPLSFRQRWIAYYRKPADQRDVFDMIWLWLGLE